MGLREVVSISLPPQRARELRRTASDEGVTVSEFLRIAVTQKLRIDHWKKIRKRGAQTARKFKISPEEIEAIVDEFRE